MLKTVSYSIPNISCGHCVHTIQTEIGELEGVHSVKAQAETRQVEISFDAPATEAQILSLLEEIHYPAALP